MEKTIKIEEASGYLDRIDRSIRSICRDSGSAGARFCLESHFLKRQMEPRKDSFPPVGFWANTDGTSVNESIEDTVFSGDDARIRISSPALAHKLDPNPPPITPKGKKYLTLPAIAEATRRPAIDFIGLKMAFVDGRPALVRGEEKEVVFHLAKKVQTPHDPHALPADADFEKAISAAIVSAVETLLNSP